MPVLKKLPIALGLVFIVGACAQEEPPQPITISPTIDKLGNATCPAGTTLAIDGATGAEICVDPATV